MFLFTASKRKIFLYLLFFACSAPCIFGMQMPDTVRDDGAVSFPDWCNKQIDFTLNEFPDPFEWFPYPRTHKALLSPEEFADWWLETYKGDIDEFKSWNGLSSFFTALTWERKIDKLEDPAPPISQYLDIYFRQVNKEHLIKWKQIFEQNDMKTLEDVSLRLSAINGKIDWEKIGIPGFVGLDLESKVREYDKAKAMASREPFENCFGELRKQKINLDFFPHLFSYLPENHYALSSSTSFIKYWHKHTGETITGFDPVASSFFLEQD
jgi:hypothetical protein